MSATTPMRVLLVSGTFPPGQCGIGDYTARLASALAALDGVRVGVLTQAPAGQTAAPGAEILPVAASWGLAGLLSLLRRVREWKPDIVHFHFPSQGFGLQLAPALLPLACRLAGLAVVQTWHEPWPLLGAPRFLLQLAGADGLVFVRPNYAALLPRALRPLLRARMRRTIASAGALPASRLAVHDRELLRARYLSGKDRLVLFFGFIYPSKGVEQLFDIADPRSHALVIAGPANDPAYLEQLKTLAAQRGWGGQLQYTGFLAQQDAADLVAAADAVVLPFLGGGGDWNTSIHAALAQGTLVITTAAQPRGDDPVRNLYTAGIGDIGAMRQALNTLAGRRVAAPPDDGWAPIALSHAEFYARVLDRPSAGAPG